MSALLLPAKNKNDAYLLDIRKEMSMLVHPKGQQWKNDSTNIPPGDWSFTAILAISLHQLEASRSTRKWFVALEALDGEWSPESVAGIKPVGWAVVRTVQMLGYHSALASANICSGRSIITVKDVSKWQTDGRQRQCTRLLLFPPLPRSWQRTQCNQIKLHLSHYCGKCKRNHIYLGYSTRGYKWDKTHRCGYFLLSFRPRSEWSRNKQEEETLHGGHNKSIDACT